MIGFQIPGRATTIHVAGTDTDPVVAHPQLLVHEARLVFKNTHVAAQQSAVMAATRMGAS